MPQNASFGFSAFLIVHLGFSLCNYSGISIFRPSLGKFIFLNIYSKQHGRVGMSKVLGNKSK